MVIDKGAYKPPPSSTEKEPLSLCHALPSLKDTGCCDCPWQGCCGTFGWWAGHSEFSLHLPLSRSILSTRRENQATVLTLLQDQYPTWLASLRLTGY